MTSQDASGILGIEIDGNDEKAYSMSFLKFSIDLSMSIQLDVKKGAISVLFFGGFFDFVIDKKVILMYLIGMSDFLI